MVVFFQAMCSVKPQISSMLPHYKPVSMPIVSTSSSTTSTELPHDFVSTSTSTRNVLLESLTSSKSRKPPTQTSSLVSSKPPSYNKPSKIKLAANFETKKPTTNIGNDESRNKKPVGYVHRRPDDPDQNSSLPVTNGKPRTALIRTLYSTDVVSGHGKSTYNPRRYKDSSSQEYGIVFEEDEPSQRLKQSVRGQRNNPPNARGFNGSRGRNGSNYGLHVTGSEISYGNSKKETGRGRGTQGRKTMKSETPYSSRSDYKDSTSIRPNTDEKRRLPKPYSNSHVTKSS